MPNTGGQGQITVDVGVKLNVLQSSIKDMQKILSSLKPDSTAFQSLTKILGEAQREMEKLQVTTAKPFGSQAEFNKAEKSLEKIDKSLTSAGFAASRIRFKDLQLTQEQINSFEALDKTLQDAQNRVTEVKETVKQGLLGDDVTKSLIEGIDVNLIDKSFDEIAKRVTAKVEQLNRDVHRGAQKLADVSKEQEKGDRAKKLVSSGISEDALGPEIFKKFFQATSKGIQFKTTGFKKGELKTQFLLALKEEFNLTDADIEPLKNLTFGELNKMFQQMGTGETNNIFQGLIEKIQQDLDNSAKLIAEHEANVQQLKQYQQVQANIADEKGDNGRVGQAEAAARKATEEHDQAERNLQAQLTQNVKTQQDYVKGIEQARQATADMTDAVNEGNDAFKEQSRVSNTFDSIKTSISSFLGFNQVLNITKQAISAAANHIRELDSVMNGISIVTDMTTADLWNQVDAYSEMAQNYGVTIQGAYQVSQIYYQQGLETNEVLALTNETLKLSKISGLDYATTTDYMTTAIRGFKMEMSEASKVVDVYSALAANTAVSQQELAEAMTRTASSLEGVGASFEESSSMIATMVAVTRESANNIGSALKSIASRYGELTKDPAKLIDEDGQAMSFNRVDEALQSVGISMKTVDGQFRNFTDVIVELGEKWATLDSVSQRYIATQFAGNRQQSRFLALVSNVDLLKANMDVAANSEDTGTLQAIKALDSLESKINQVQVSYQQFYTTIGLEQVWKTALTGIKNYIDTLNGLPKLFGKIPTSAIALIANMVNVIKGLLTAGISSIAKIVESTLKNTVENAKNTASDGGTQVAENWLTKLINRIKQGRGEVSAAMQDTVQQASNSATTVQVGGQSIAVDQFQTVFSDPNNTKDTDALKKALTEIGVSAESVQTKVINAFHNIQEESKKSGEPIENLGNAILKTLENEKKSVEQPVTGVKKFGKELVTAGSKTQKVVTGIAQTLTTVGLLINDGTEKTRAMSGAMTTVGGIMQTGIGVARVWSGDLTAIPDIISGIMSTFSGFDLLVEDNTEKLERLTKEAQELQNVAKKARAEANQIDRAKQKLEELDAKRFDSAEAAEEYQEAVQDLADQFPELITGFDEAGNAIIETRRLEELLAKARQESAKATLEAAQGEYKKKAQEAKTSFEEKAGYLNPGDFNPEFSLYHVPEDSWSFLRSYARVYGGTTQETIDHLPSDLFQSDQGKSWLNNLVQTTGHSTEDLQPQFIQNQKEAYEILTAIHDKSFFSLALSEQERQLKALEEAGKFVIQSSTEYTDKGTSETDDVTFINNVHELQETIQAYWLLNQSKESIISAIQQSFNSTGEFKMLSESAQFSNMVAREFATNHDLNEEGKLSDTDKQELLRFTTFINDWYKTIDQQYFNQLIQNSNKYSYNDIMKEFDIAEGSSVQKTLYNTYKKYFLDTENQINNKIQNSKLNQTTKDSFLSAFEQFDETALTPYYQSLINNIINLGEDLQIHGLSTQSSNVITQGQELITKLYDLDGTVDAAILQIILDNGFTLEGINESIKQISSGNYEDQELVGQITGLLTDLSSSMVNNVSIRIKSATEAFTQEATTFASESKKLTSGMSFEEAQSMMNKMNAVFNETQQGTTITVKDFITSGENLILTQEQAWEYEDAWLASQTSKYKELKQKADAEKTLFEDWSKTEGNAAIDELNKDEFKELIRTHSELEKYITRDADNNISGITKQAEFNEALKNITDADQQNLEDFYHWIELQTEQLQKMRKWKAGNFTGLNISNFSELLKFDADLSKQSADVKEAVNHAREGYSKLIDDALTYGLDHINFNNYDYILKEDRTASIPERYQDLINNYAEKAGKSIAEINSLLVQAIEKDSHVSLNEAIKNIRFFSSNSMTATLETAQKIADALGLKVSDIIGEYNEELGEYWLNQDLFDQEAIKGKVSNISDIVTEGISETIQTVIAGIQSGIAGKMSQDELNSINTYLKENELGKLEEHDFIKTAEGLKLSQDAAMRLYSNLKQVDAISAQIVFNALVDSLEEADSGFSTIAETMKRIKGVQTELTNAIQSGNDTEKEKIPTLQKQLSLYLEIARAQAMKPENYSYMDRALPDQFKGPENYWNSTLQAIEVMQASAESGYMGIQDFYNIITEMNNTAALTDNEPIVIMGQKLDGNAKTAAELIKKAFGAIEMIPGEGAKINLGKIGISFEEGADDFSDGITTGMKAMAESQIKMLDGIIQLLETVVAMEQLKDISSDGETIQIKDIFPEIEIGDDGLGTKYRTEFQDAADYILTMAEGSDDLTQALDNIKVKNYSLRQMFEDAADGVYDLKGLAAGEYAAAIDAFYRALQSDNFSLDNLNSVIEELAKTGVNTEITLPDGQEIIIKNNSWAVKSENGKFVANDGTECDTTEQALNRNLLLSSGLGVKKIEPIENTDEMSGTIIYGKKETIVQTESGEIKYHSTITNENYDSMDALIKAEYDQQAATLASIEGGSAQYIHDAETYAIAVGYTVVPTINSEDVHLSATQLENLNNTTATQLQKEYAQNPLDFQVTYGISLVNGQISEDELNAFLESQGVESKIINTKMKPEFDETVPEPIRKMLESEESSTTVKINLILGEYAQIISALGLNGTDLSGLSVESVDVLVKGLKLIQGYLLDGGKDSGVDEGGLAVPGKISDIALVSAAVLALALVQRYNDGEFTEDLNKPTDVSPIPNVDSEVNALTLKSGYESWSESELGINNITKAKSSVPSLEALVESLILAMITNPPNPEEQDIVNAFPKEASQSIPYLDVFVKALNLLSTLNGEGAQSTDINEDNVEVPTKLSSLLTLTALVSLLNLAKNDNGFSVIDTNIKLADGTEISPITWLKALVQKLSLQPDDNGPNGMDTDKVAIEQRANNEEIDVPNVQGNVGNLTLKDKPVRGLDDKGVQIPDVLPGDKDLIAKIANLILAWLNPDKEDNIDYKNVTPDSSFNIDQELQALITKVIVGWAGKENYDFTNVTPKEVTVETPIDVVNRVKEENKDALDIAQMLARPKLAGELGWDFGDDWASATGNHQSTLTGTVGDHVKDYIDDLTDMVNEGKTLTALHKQNLDKLAQYSNSFKIDDNTTLGEAITNIQSLNTALEEEQSKEIGSVAKAFQNIDVSSLDKAAASMATLYADAKGLTEIDWDTLNEHLKNLHFELTPSENNQVIEETLSVSTDTSAMESNVQTYQSNMVTVLATLVDATATIVSNIDTIQQSINNSFIAALTEIADTIKKFPSFVKQVRALNDLNQALSSMPNIAGKFYSLGGGISNAATQLSIFMGVLASSTNKLRQLINILNERTPTGPANAGGKGTSGFKKVSTETSFAQAKGTSTLMGELGPELYVTGGHYYIAGQNGAEFVDLPADAIVFNHLQTEKLLSGKSTGHGKPVTSEKRAVSRATGNAGGPAMASASEALAEYQKLRAMWKSMLDANLKDLASQAGGGGGGGGGKRGPTAGYVADLERWYNLLRQIDKLERDITYQENLRSKIESDRVINGEAYYRSQKKSLDLLKTEISRQRELGRLQESYYEARRRDLAESQFGKIFTFNEEGLMQYNDEGMLPNGDHGGLRALAKLNQTNPETGAPVLSDEEQYNLLVSWGFGDLLKQDTSGKDIDFSEDENAYTTAVGAFWDIANAWMEELDSLYDSYNETANSILELESSRNELLQEMIDNQLEVEQSVMKAIEDSRQVVIDEAQKERDALSESSQLFLDGLSKQLDRERDMYQTNESAQELDRMRRRLGILQRSGGSASSIRSLQNQITSREQELYFTEQQSQIDAIKEASDAELARLDAQIDLMTETLEYQKEHGLLWKDVYTVMNLTKAEIAQFITGSTKDWAAKSDLAKTEDLRVLSGQIEQWVARRDDPENPVNAPTDNGWDSYINSLGPDYHSLGSDPEAMKAMKAAYDKTYAETGDSLAASKAADAAGKKILAEKNKGQEAPVSTTPSGETSAQTQGKTLQNTALVTIQHLNSNGKWLVPEEIFSAEIGTKIHAKDYAKTNLGSYYASPESLTVGTGKNWINIIYGQTGIQVSGYNGYDILYNDKVVAGGYGYGKDLKSAGEKALSAFSAEYPGIDSNKLKLRYKNYNGEELQGYSSGGLNDYTGLAMLHGTRSRPEGILNADQTRILRNDILSSKPTSLLSLLSGLQHTMSQFANTNDYNTINNSTAESVVIEKAEVNMNVASIANDYDARRAGQNAMDEMLRIARKNGINTLRR